MEGNIALAQAFMDNLNRLTYKDDADFALQHMKLCRSFITEHGVSMTYLANSMELLDKQQNGEAL